MKSRKFGSTNRLVPVIGQGTWNVPEHGRAAEEAATAIRAGIEQGMVHIDTAEMYGSGKAEELVGKAIEGLPRDELFLVSKVLPQNASFKGTIKACEASLRRLKTDYLDCYLLHWRGNQPLDETMSALEQLVDDGKIKSLGVSNFDLSDLQEAAAAIKKHEIACNQVLYNIFTRGIERRIVPFCLDHKIATVAYTPFAQKSVPALRTAGGGILERISKKHDATIHQVMLAFLTRLDNFFAIPKAANPRHALENAAAADLILDQKDIAELDTAFPAPGKDVPLAVL